ncbi:MAG: hypothetical protein K2Q18_06060 [Bdellovibrionales bacterium]|nr:hypothetical protein [Bdellovibrionales bacterium]
MEQKGSLLNWKLSLIETLGFGMTVASLVYFLTDNFQSKEEGKKLENRIENVERDLASLRSGVNQIAVDVSFIRGALTTNTK